MGWLVEKMDGGEIVQRASAHFAMMPKITARSKSPFGLIESSDMLEAVFDVAEIVGDPYNYAYMYFCRGELVAFATPLNKL